MSIDISHIIKRFDSHVALDDVSLRVGDGELVALLGPSGSGKTTLLRVIAGLEQPDGGRVQFHEQDVSRTRVGDRRVGFVFQHYALFRHMTVFENVAFGLRSRPWQLRPSRREVRAKVEELLHLVQLDLLAGRYPSQLSGGQRQRVALARALAIEPRVLLLDEPFGALDARVRRELRTWLRRLHDRLHITSVFVTHDQEEALEVADRIVVMREGRIEQVGTPEEVYERPATPFVYQFLGNVNLFHGRLDSGRLRIGSLHLPAESAGDKAIAYVRPHDVEISLVVGEDTLPARVERVRFAGGVVHVELEHEGHPITAALSRQRHRELGLKPGDLVQLQLHEAKVFADDYSI